MYNLRQSVINVIRDRVIYDLAVALSIFPQGKGNQDALVNGEKTVISWRNRPEVIRMIAQQSAVIDAKVEILAKAYAIAVGKLDAATEEQASPAALNYAS